MRASILAILVAASLVPLVPPADAHGGGFSGGGRGAFFHSHGFARFGFPFNNNAFAFNNGVGFGRAGFPFNNNAFAFNNGVGFGHRGVGWGSSGFGFGALLGGVPYGVDVAGQGSGQAPNVVVVTVPAPTPPARLADERPSIETTPQGVTIIRGPGSMHIAQ